MKVAVICQSPADQAAIRILVEAILQTDVEVAEEPRPRTGGWSAIPKAFPILLRHFYYLTDVEALIVIGDSDDTPAHQAEHDEAGKEEQACRLCTLRRIVVEEHKKLKPRPHGRPAQDRDWYRRSGD